MQRTRAITVTVIVTGAMATIAGGVPARAAGDATAPRELAQDRGEVFALPGVEIIGVSPVLGTGIAKDKVPANVQTVTPQEMREKTPLSLGDALNSEIGSVTINEVQNNPFQPDVQFRGFTASPLLGTPQGIAVYQNGSRINEAFGDVVQWDTIPQFAIGAVEIIPGSNPVYGLNALGGALALQMKNGFTFEGTEMEAYGGSFGRYQVTGQTGLKSGNFAFYGGVTGFAEDGWRQHSPSDVQQVYADGRWRGESGELGVNLLYSNSDLIGNGLSPVELLAADRSAIFTFPDQTKNEVLGIASQGDAALTDTVSLQGNAYYRHLRRDTLNGDQSEFEDCTGIGGPPGTLCEDAGTPDEEQIEDLSGNPIPTAVGGDGVLNGTGTSTDMAGGALQTTVEERLFGLENHLVAGVSVDFGFVSFNSQSEVGMLTEERGVAGSGIFVGGDEFNTRLDATNRYLGVYVSDTLSLTDALSATFAGRFNHAEIELEDRLGTELTGDHSFDRFNPALGLAYKLNPDITLFGGYSESNRAPTAVELSCADPDRPCRLPNAFVSDPPLKQVVSRSVELGARGRVADLGDMAPINWSLAAFGSRNFDDIIFVSAGPTIGSGFFQNAGITQRLGVEAGVNGKVGDVRWYVDYAFVNATFESNLSIASPNHPLAVDGEIPVRPGDRIPGIPQHTAKLGLGYDVTPEWSVLVESIIAGDQFARGDEANLLDPVDGYAIVNLHSAYRIGDHVELFVKVNNLFDTDYETFGTLGDPTEVFPAFSDPRFLSPGAPIGAWAGLRVRI
jgi:outer membrane receptor protein involved in Fe transport